MDEIEQIREGIPVNLLTTPVETINDQTPKILSGNGPPFDHVLAREEKIMFWKAMFSLPEKQMKALYLTYFEDMTNKDIGKVLGVTGARVGQISSAGLTLFAKKHKKIQKEGAL